MTTTTPLMLLVLPDDHGSTDQWDTILDAVFNLIDGHDHTTGKGSKIKMSAVAIDGDVSWSASGISRAITDLRALDFVPVASSTVTGMSGAFFVNAADNELYFRSQAGTNIKITAGNSLNVVQFTGGIGGDYSAVGALLSYDDATRSYWLQQEGFPRPWASLRTGDVQIFQAAASITQAVTLRSPPALATGYIIILPAALPSTRQAMTLDSSGNCALGLAFSLNANNDITLSGTGTYRHGPKTITKIVGTGDLLSTTGTVGAVTNVAGVTIGSGASGATAILRLPDLPDYVTISQVTFLCPTSSDATNLAGGTSVLVSVTPPSTAFNSLGSGTLFHPSGSNIVASGGGVGTAAKLVSSAQASVISVSVTYSV